MGYVSSLDKSKDRIILYACISNLVSILLFLMVGRVDGIVSVMVIWVRCMLFLRRDKYKTNIIVWLCAIAHLIVGIISYDDIFSLITILVPIVVCFTYWYGSALTIKYVSIIVGICWIVYYLYVELYITVLNTLVNIVLSLISIYLIKKDVREVPTSDK